LEKEELKNNHENQYSNKAQVSELRVYGIESDPGR